MGEGRGRGEGGRGEGAGVRLTAGSQTERFKAINLKFGKTVACSLNLERTVPDFDNIQAIFS